MAQICEKPGRTYSVTMWLKTIGGYEMYRIARNIIRCRQCGDIIESRPGNSERTCSCGNCTIGGGDRCFIRRCLSGRNGYDEISKVEDLW